MLRIFLAFLLSVVVQSPLYALVDQSYSLEEVLEYGTLTKADCDRYRAGQTDRETELRCGKWMFFYDTLGIPGIPAPLLDLLRENAPNSVGPSLEKFGLIRDPYSKKKLPVGVIDGPKLFGNVKSYTTVCTMCHFGQTPDGRYVVGQPNHNMDFSRLVLSVNLIPELAINPKKPLPEVTQKLLQPIVDEFFGKDWSRLKAIAATIALLPNAIKNKPKPMTEDQLRNMSGMPPGIVDPFAPPLLDDGVNIPLRILPLYGIEIEAMKAAGAQNGGMLASAGGTPDFEHIHYATLLLTDLSAGTNLVAGFDVEYFKPLTAYILSLKPPKNQMPFDEAQLARGKALFEKSCSSCHNGPGYAGTKVFDLDEIGTDPNLKYQLDPTFSGVALGNVAKPYELTYGVRAGRLTGIWSYEHFFHNGSLSSLDEIFCLKGPRPPSKGNGHSTGGHMWTCNDFSPEEKVDLRTFVESL